MPTTVSWDQSRVVYKRPNFDREISGEWGRFTYNTSDKEGKSLDGTVVLVPPSGILVASEFYISEEGWSTIGNRKQDVTHEQSSRGIMNHYIYAVDDSLNTDQDGNDIDVWYFVLPTKFHGWQGVAYGGKLEFTLSSFGGDFSQEMQNFPGKLNIVEITCDRCNMFKGITIGFPLAKTSGFNGFTTSFSFELTESSGWLKDPKSSILEWKPPSKCDFIEVLSGISNIKILGDFTTWYESVSIDNVRLIAAKSKGRWQVPVCAQITPDARKCSCK